MTLEEGSDGRARTRTDPLVLSVVGSACIVLTVAVPPSASTPLMLLGRVLQGFSAAAILSSSLAVIKAHYHDRNRQRASSFWSIGSFGGSALTALVGGIVASTLEWRWNFGLQIIVSVVVYVLLAGVPETRSETAERHRFDTIGLLTFLVAIITLNVIISFSGKLFPFFGATTLVLARCPSALCAPMMNSSRRAPISCEVSCSSARGCCASNTTFVWSRTAAIAGRTMPPFDAPVAGRSASPRFTHCFSGRRCELRPQR
jgi:MFS family permease